MRLLLMLLAALLLVPLAAAQGSGQTVAVLDTGIDADHAEFGDRVERRSFVEYAQLPLDPGELEDDPDGHGTAAASLVGGAALGVAPEAGLLDLQVAGRYTQGQFDPATEDAAVRALDWLLRNHGGPNQTGPRVALLSFASNPVTEEGAATLRAQTQQLFESGVAVVVPDTGSPGVLHASPWVLTVARQEECADAPEGINPKPDLGAPGEELEVAVPGNAAMSDARGTATGTHLAAAQVAGALAVMFSQRPDLPADAAYALLRGTAQDAQEPGHDTCIGAGLLDVEGALARAANWTDPFALQDSPSEDSPGPGAVLVAGLLTAVWLRRR